MERGVRCALVAAATPIASYRGHPRAIGATHGRKPSLTVQRQHWHSQWHTNSPPTGTKSLLAHNPKVCIVDGIP